MKHLALFFTIFVSTTLAAAPCTNVEREIGQQLYSAAVQAYEEHNISLIEKLTIEGIYLESQYCAGSLSKVQYCTQKREVLTHAMQIVIDSSSSENRRILTVRGPLKDLLDHNLQCAE